MHLCRVILKGMKMSRRSTDASQKALAYNRMVDGLNEFRLGYKSAHFHQFFFFFVIYSDNMRKVPLLSTPPMKSECFGK